MLREEGLLLPLRRLSVTGRDHGGQRRGAEEWGGQVLEKSPPGPEPDVVPRAGTVGQEDRGARTEIKGVSGGF